MNVKQYLKLAKATENTQVTFIKARARKDAHTPYYHYEYQTTSIFSVRDLKESKLMDYIVLNDKQSPIDWLSGAPWNNQFKRGDLLSMLIVSEDDLRLGYSEEQSKSMEQFIDKKLLESLGK